MNVLDVVCTSNGDNGHKNRQALFNAQP